MLTEGFLKLYGWNMSNQQPNKGSMTSNELIKIREDLGYDRKEFSEMLMVKDKHLYRLENGKLPITTQMALVVILVKEKLERKPYLEHKNLIKLIHENFQRSTD